MSAIRPTKAVNYARTGDTVTHIGSVMRGHVVRVRKLAVPTATVRWSNGSVGRHSLACLVRVDSFPTTNSESKP